MPGLTQKQIEARIGKLTSTSMAALMTGDREAILNLWRKMTDDPSYIEPDLSDVWPVQLGATTEQLNLDWFERKHGTVIRRGEVAIDPDLSWAAATLDGWCVSLDMPVEAKHVGGREPLERIVERYQPQMQWAMAVTHANQIGLTVIFGANEPIVEFIPYAPMYAAEMKHRGEQFMDFVRRRVPPVQLDAVAPPVLAVKTYDMSENNEWGHNAIAWLDTRKAREECVIAEKNLKLMVPADAKITRGRGIVITRNRAGSLSLREDVR